MNGPRWIKQWISDMAALNEQFRNDDGLVDFDALGREEYSFRVALITKKFGKSERAREIYRVAKIAYDSSVENGKKGGRPKKNPQDAPNGNAGVDMHDAGNGAASKSPTSCDQFTADGDIREDSQARPDGSAITRNETRAHDALEPSANIYGDAATREGAEVVDSRESGAAVPTTVSRNMRRVPQNEAPAHGFSGGRTAQGTMSRSPEAAAQSGKDYDKEPAKTRDTRDDSRGRYAPPSCSPEDGNPAETAPSHGGSVASLEARLSQGRTGGNSLRVAKVSTSPVRSAGPMPDDVQQVYDFAAAENLDPVDAYECWNVTVNERDGKTADGKKVTNWKAYVRQWCETRANNRRTA
ncbi:hypothetical protein [uncultured Fibrobacter sp.]|uniref:hypothetical protein n=1 Tax=uncultured Fibrobacter sp. TaxID=261512 RepID=UPI0025FBE9AA|nr:hypothetical protein [uncultured Fibrobacter sp.]